MTNKIEEYIKLAEECSLYWPCGIDAVSVEHFFRDRGEGAIQVLNAFPALAKALLGTEEALINAQSTLIYSGHPPLEKVEAAYTTIQKLKEQA